MKTCAERAGRLTCTCDNLAERPRADFARESGTFNVYRCVTASNMHVNR